jgi:hypothetical protein
MTGRGWAIVGAIICAAALAACTSPPIPTDPTAQRLVGRWSQIFSFEGIRDEISIDLRPDATVEVKIRRHSGSGIHEYAGSGKWRVEEGYFISELAFTGPRNAVNHLVGRHRILSVTEWQWVSDYRNGQHLTAWRYPK